MRYNFLFKVRPNNEVEAPVVRISNNDRDIQVQCTSSESTNMRSSLWKWTNQTMGPMWTIGLGIDPKLCLLLQKNLDFFHNRICIQTQNRVHIEETLRMNTIFISIKSKAELLWWWSLPYLCYLILPIRCQRQYLIWYLATPENTTFEFKTDPSENYVKY